MTLCDPSDTVIVVVCPPLAAAEGDAAAGALALACVLDVLDTLGAGRRPVVVRPDREEDSGAWRALVPAGVTVATRVRHRAAITVDPRRPDVTRLAARLDALGNPSPAPRVRSLLHELRRGPTG